MHTEMSTQARELAAAAYGAGEMDFPIGVAAAELAAAHAGQPDRLLRAGKAIAAAAYAAAYAAADEDASDELFDEWEELASYYENYVPDDGEPDPELDRQPWAGYTRGQLLTAVYLLVTQHAEDEQTPKETGWDAQRLLGSLSEHLRRELGSLGNVDPLDLADELAAASA